MVFRFAVIYLTCYKCGLFSRFSAVFQTGRSLIDRIFLYIYFSIFKTLKPTLTDFLAQYITDNKKDKIEQALEHRTRHLTVVVEDVYQPHNASAVIRTCDCFGIQELHIIENRNRYNVNPDVALGASKWVDVIRHHEKKDVSNTPSCIDSLRERGYRIIATTPHRDDVNLAELPLDQKTALLFGNELEGLSEEAIKNADGFMRIPMVGFTESLNLSVSAAICIHFLRHKLEHSEGIYWKLSNEEKEEIRLRWYRSIIKKSEVLEQEFLKK